VNYLFYLLRLKAAHNTYKERQATTNYKTTKTEIHTQTGNYKKQHTINEIVLQASVHNHFLKCLPDMKWWYVSDFARNGL